MPERLDIALGDRYGRLVILKEIEKEGQLRRFETICDCGNKKIAKLKNLRNGHLQSCGCYRIETSKKTPVTHSMTGTPTYITWNSMLQRVQNQKSAQYHLYGGRGITVCDRWLRFENFLSDMGERPTHKSQIDRINTNGNYEPSNCRWTEASVNAQNKRPHNKTGLKGVYPHGKGYQAFIQKEGTQYPLGTYKTPNQAAEAYDAKALELFGPLACTNRSLGLIE